MASQPVHVGRASAVIQEDGNGVQSTTGPRRACEVVSDFEERNEVLDAYYENMKAMMQGMEFEKD
jgi:hypothetical protein